MALLGIVMNNAGLDMDVRTPWGYEMKNGTLSAVSIHADGTPTGKSQKFDPAKMFGGWEIPNYLEYYLQNVDYVIYTTDTVEVFETVVSLGYFLPESYGGKHFTQIFSNWRDGKGKCIMVDSKAGVKNIDTIGVMTFMKTWEDSVKAGKYINRLFAPSAVGTEIVFGEEVSFDAETKISIYQLSTGINLTVKYVDLKTMDKNAVAMVDGELTFSVNGDKKLGGNGKNPRRVTLGTPRGTGKGDGLPNKNQKVDVIIWGPKTIVRTKSLVFNDMGRLHSGSPRTDIQSIINFMMDPLLVDLADAYMRWVWKSSHDNNGICKAMRSTVRSMINPFMADPEVHVSMEDTVDFEIERRESFPLLRFIESGVSPFSMAWLYRRVVRHLLKKVMKCEKGEIPMAWGNGEGVATSAYAMGDPTAITPDGHIDVTKSQLKYRHVCNPNLPDGVEIVLYRQPSGTRNEHVIVRNQHVKELMSYKGMDIFFIGADAVEIAAILGGMDMDDNIIQVYDKRWVAHFKGLSAYPSVEPLEITESEENNTKKQAKAREFMQSLINNNIIPDVKKYGHGHAVFQAQMARKQSGGIGVVVSAGFSDTVLSNYGDFISNWLAEEGMGDEVEKFDKRPKYQMRKLLTHLEVVIDGAVKDPALLASLGNVAGICKNYHKAAGFYPKFLESRIPKSKFDKGDYTLVQTPIDDAFDTIVAHRDGLEEAFRKMECALVKPVPTEVKHMFPQDSYIDGITFGDKENGTEGLRPLWKELWAKSFNRNTAGDDYKPVTKIVEQFLENYKPELPEIAWRLYCYHYSRNVVNKEEENGKSRGHNDALLGVKSIANALLDALEMHGMTGKTYTCDFDLDVVKFSNVQMMVNVKQGLVYQAKTGRVVGMSLRCPDGHYPMIAGSIEVTPAAEFLLAPPELDTISAPDWV